MAEFDHICCVTVTTNLHRCLTRTAITTSWMWLCTRYITRRKALCTRNPRPGSKDSQGRRLCHTLNLNLCGSWAGYTTNADEEGVKALAILCRGNWAFFIGIWHQTKEDTDAAGTAQNRQTRRSDGIRDTHLLSFG